MKQFVVGGRERVMRNDAPRLAFSSFNRIVEREPVITENVARVESSTLIEGFARASALLQREGFRQECYLAGRNVMLQLLTFEHRPESHRYFGYFKPRRGSQYGERGFTVHDMDVYVDPEPSHAWRVTAAPEMHQALQACHAYVDLNPDGPPRPLIVEAADYGSLAAVLKVQADQVAAAWRSAARPRSAEDVVAEQVLWARRRA